MLVGYFSDDAGEKSFACKFIAGSQFLEPSRSMGQ
jgi:hypothetical protein